MLREDDLVMTRILWLDGLEPRNANTHDRYVYIHGTNHEDEIGTAASHGCIRMRNTDVLELFERVDAGTPVEIRP
jgi:lipoprotein-anchoring transpeptidase ErfK/SrfK